MTTLHRNLMIVFTTIVAYTGICEDWARAREWTDSTGKHTVQADLVKHNAQHVTLRRPDGQVVNIPLERLSQQDREYLNQLAETERSGESDSNDPPSDVANNVDDGAAAVAPIAPPPMPPPPSADEIDRSSPLPTIEPVPTEEDRGPAESISTEVQADDSTGADFVEVKYQGQTIRIPIGEQGAREIELGGNKFKLLFADDSASFAGNNVAAPIDTSPATVAAETNTPVVPSSPPGPSTPMIATIAVLTTVVIALLGYFLIFEPLRKEKPLREALRIIERDQRSLYPQAEDLLSQALLAGLRKKNVAVARFLLAYLRCLLGKYDEAATVLSDLEKSGAKIDRPTAYLMLWTQSKLKNHERVERIYSEYEKMLKGYQQSTLIVSMSYLGLAFLRLARREINGALHYFERVQSLKVLADEVPTHLDDHEVVAGVVSLFEKNKDEAIKHFDAAVKTAKERGKPSSPGRLGLLLCQWQSESLPDIDVDLATVLSEMQPEAVENEKKLVGTKCPHCDTEYTVKSSYVGKRVQCKQQQCRRRFLIEIQESVADDGDDSAVSEDRLFSDSDLLLRNTLLWHCVARFAVWLRQEERSGLSDAELELMRKRLQLVTDLDPDFGDPYLIGGLTDFYFATTEEDRKRGREMIERAVELEVHVPEVLQLLDRINKLASLAEHSLSYFHQLSNQYAMNEEVDPQLRDRFVRNMSRYSRFRELGDIDQLPPDQATAPTLENLRGRGEILRNRVSNIVRFNLADEKPDVKAEIEGRLGDLEEKSHVLTKEARAFQQTELQLMESTGEFLFHDEEIELNETGPPDGYRFAAFYCEQLEVGQVGSLIAYAYGPTVDLRSLAEEAAARIQRPAGAKITAGVPKETGHVTRDQEIIVTIDVDGLEFESRQARLKLWSDQQSAEFRFHCPESSAGRTLQGSIDYWLGRILIAAVPIRVVVAADDLPEELHAALAQVNAKPYRNVFPSYSHDDEEIVEQIELYVDAFGDSYFRDVKKLRTGETWNSQLLRFIQKADVFQLFWSPNAANSPYVQQEWIAALKERTSRGDPYFVRPVFWTDEPVPQPPTDLEQIHFAKLPSIVIGRTNQKAVPMS